MHKVPLAALVLALAAGCSSSSDSTDVPGGPAASSPKGPLASYYSTDPDGDAHGNATVDASVLQEVDRLGRADGYSGPAVAVTPDGTATVAWLAGGVRIRQAPAREPWGPEEQVPGTKGRLVYLLGMGTDRAGRVTVVWKRALRLYASSRSREGEWSEPQLISTGGFGGQIPVTEFSPSGAAIVAWSNGGSQFVVYRGADGTWTERTALPAADPRRYSAVGLPAVAMSPDGVPSVAYVSELQDALTAGRAPRLDVMQRGEDGWRSRLVLEAPRTDYDAVALDGVQGRDVQVAWTSRTQGTGLRAVYLTQPTSSGWTQRRLISPQAKPIEMLDVHAAPDGSALVAWALGPWCGRANDVWSASVASSGELIDSSVRGTHGGSVCYDPTLSRTEAGDGLLSWVQGGRMLTAFWDAAAASWEPLVDSGAVTRGYVLSPSAAALAPDRTAVVAWSARGIREMLARRTTYPSS